MGKRPDGALEHDVLRVIWASRSALMPAEVLAGLGLDLAYTSVSTVLSRLHDKGLVTREQRGRGYAYRAALSESELAARKMGDALRSTANRKAALVGFVGSLSKREVSALKAVLEEPSS